MTETATIHLDDDEQTSAAYKTKCAEEAIFKYQAPTSTELMVGGYAISIRGMERFSAVGCLQMLASSLRAIPLGSLLLGSLFIWQSILPFDVFSVAISLLLGFLFTVRHLLTKQLGKKSGPNLLKLHAQLYVTTNLFFLAWKLLSYLLDVTPLLIALRTCQEPLDQCAVTALRQNMRLFAPPALSLPMILFACTSVLLAIHTIKSKYPKYDNALAYHVLVFGVSSLFLYLKWNVKVYEHGFHEHPPAFLLFVILWGVVLAVHLWHLVQQMSSVFSFNFLGVSVKALKKEHRKIV